MLEKYKYSLKKIISSTEHRLLGDYFFSLSELLSIKQRIYLLFYFFFLHLRKLIKKDKTKPPGREISALVYSAADQRMLIPLVLRILSSAEFRRDLRINLLLFKDIPQQTAGELRSSGCHIEKTFKSLLRACFQPRGKVVLLCLDQRYFYHYHRYGVDTAEVLKQFKVKTISIQHGGSRKDSVEGLASSASDILMVFGKKIFTDLHSTFHRDRTSLRLTGNPLHDRLFKLDKRETLRALSVRHPHFTKIMTGKRIIFFGGCLHDYYDSHQNPEKMYRTYVRHIYKSIDFTTAILLVQPHPEDRERAKWYYELIPGSCQDSILFIDSQPVESVLDAYSLINISDLLITLASTLAEEALILKKPVLAFDLLEEGRTKQYRHLEYYRFYKTVYAAGKNSLKDSIKDMLRDLPAGAFDAAKVIEDYAYRLDGHSTERAVAEILRELDSRPPEKTYLKKAFFRNNRDPQTNPPHSLL